LRIMQMPQLLQALAHMQSKWSQSTRLMRRPASSLRRATMPTLGRRPESRCDRAPLHVQSTHTLSLSRSSRRVGLFRLVQRDARARQCPRGPKYIPISRCRARSSGRVRLSLAVLIHVARSATMARLSTTINRCAQCRPPRARAPSHAPVAMLACTTNAPPALSTLTSPWAAHSRPPESRHGASHPLQFVAWTLQTSLDMTGRRGLHYWLQCGPSHLLVSMSL